MPSNHALITGAASGIGRAIAIALADTSVHVTLTDIAESGLAETSSLISSGNRTNRIMDVTSTAAVNQTITEAEQNNGPIDVLVNCAGWDSLMPFLDTDEAFWDRIIDLNFKGTLRTTHAVLPAMIDNRAGRIVNIASDAGRVGSSLEAVYSGAKGAVIAFSKTIAREVARYGITVNCVCPGPTETALLDEITAASQDGDKVISSMTRSVPMRRLGTPEDIAGAVVYLASDQAGFVTGQTLSVSGGLTMA